MKPQPKLLTRALHGKTDCQKAFSWLLDKTMKNITAEGLPLCEPLNSPYKEEDSESRGCQLYSLPEKIYPGRERWHSGWGWEGGKRKMVMFQNGRYKGWGTWWLIRKTIRFWETDRLSCKWGFQRQFGRKWDPITRLPNSVHSPRLE